MVCTRLSYASAAVVILVSLSGEVTGFPSSENEEGVWPRSPPRSLLWHREQSINGEKLLAENTDSERDGDPLRSLVAIFTGNRNDRQRLHSEGTTASEGRNNRSQSAPKLPQWSLRSVPKRSSARTRESSSQTADVETIRGGEVLADESGGRDPERLVGPTTGTPWENAMEGIKNGIASGLAAAVVKTILHPFDTMKTVQQYSTSRVTLLQAGRDLVSRGGVSELYQGLGVTLVGSMPAVGVYFGLYQFVKKQLDSTGVVSPYLSITVGAGVGNFIASFFRVPYEVVKQRLQIGAYPSTTIAIRSIYKEGGLWGFFGNGGLETQWARDIPYAMVTLLVYETVQGMAAARRGQEGDKKGSSVENMIIGAIAGGAGSLATNPMDMVKTRMMTTPELYSGPMDAAWTALRNEGPQAFLKGATPRLLHKVPANAFFFVFYELFRTALGVRR